MGYIFSYFVHSLVSVYSFIFMSLVLYVIFVFVYIILSFNVVSIFCGFCGVSIKILQ